MSSTPFHYLDLRTFCYVTEHHKRVEDALRQLLPDEYSVDVADSEGHFGDRILVLSARVENEDDVRHTLDSIAEMPAEQFSRLRAELDDRIDENCAFFLTLDKQSAFNGSVERGGGITVRGKVEAYPAKKTHAVENVEQLFDEY